MIFWESIKRQLIKAKRRKDGIASRRDEQWGCFWVSAGTPFWSRSPSSRYVNWLTNWLNRSSRFRVATSTSTSPGLFAHVVVYLVRWLLLGSLVFRFNESSHHHPFIGERENLYLYRWTICRYVYIYTPSRKKNRINEYLKLKKLL